MRNSICVKLLLAGACWMVGVAAWGQQATQPNASSLDVAITYDAMLSNVTTGANFWMQGGAAQLHGQFWRGLGLVADVAGLHTASMNNSGVGLDIVTATFGPRYTWSGAHSRMSFFGHALGGGSFARNGAFPAPSITVNKANSLAMQLGGGVNVSLSHRLSLRAIEADWLRTQISDNTTNVQNSLRIGAGIVIRLR